MCFWQFPLQDRNAVPYKKPVHPAAAAVPTKPCNITFFDVFDDMDIKLAYIIAEGQPKAVYQLQTFCNDNWRPWGNYTSDHDGDISALVRVDDWTMFLPCWGNDHGPDEHVLYAWRFKRMVP